MRKLTIAPLSDIPGWLAAEPPAWAADAHRETMQAWQSAADELKNCIRGVIALDEEGDLVGIATCTDPPPEADEPPRLIVVQRDKERSVRGIGYALFCALKATVRRRPIAAVPFGDEGVPAMRGWGFIEKDGSWEYHEPRSESVGVP